MTGTGNGNNFNLLHRVKKTIEEARVEKYDYNEYRKKHELTEEEIRKQRNESFDYEPIISIITQIKDDDVIKLRRTIDSVLAQNYGGVELCIADGSVDDEASSIIAAYITDFPNIRYVRTKSSNYVGANLNEALDMAYGSYVMCLRCGDELEINAVYEFVKSINKRDRVDIIYSDNDVLSKKGLKCENPNFKPNMNMDLLRCTNYIGTPFLVRKAIAVRAGKFSEVFTSSYEYDYVLRCVEGSSNVCHISKVLCHVYPEPVQVNVDEDLTVLKQHFNRMGVMAAIKPLDFSGFYRISYHMDNTPHVTIVINDKGDEKKLRRCIDSIRGKTIYNSYDILVRKCGAKLLAGQIEGDFVVALDSDCVVMSRYFIEKLMERISQGDVSVVCAKIVDKNKRILHAGIRVNSEGNVKYMFRGMPSWQYGYQLRSILQQNVDAFPVTGILLKKEDYLELNFDAKDGVDASCCKRFKSRGDMFSFEPNVLFQQS